MNKPTRRLAILNFTDPQALIPLLRDINSSVILKGCISQADNLCYVVEGDEHVTQSIYTMLDGLKTENGELECRYVDDSYVWKEEMIIEREEIRKMPSQNFKEEQKQKEEFFDLNDDRFSALYSDSDFVIDTSHTEYKRNGLLKYIVEEKRKRLQKHL